MTNFNLKDFPASAACIFEETRINKDELISNVEKYIAILDVLNIQNLGLYLDNSPQWLYVSLAAFFKKTTIIPLPLFFSPQQLNHIINLTHMDGIFGANAETLKKLLPEGSVSLFEDNLSIITRNRQEKIDHSFKGIITFTSGTTGAPKGVLLPYENLTKQMQSIFTHMNYNYSIKYLAISPLSILLENLSTFMGLFFGGEVYINPIAKFLNLASFTLNLDVLMQYIHKHQINTLALNPYFLEQIVDALTKKTYPFPTSIKLIAVGSASTPISVLKKAEALSLPVYQGYGTSETTAVISMNNSKNNKIGSVGKLLPHVELKIGERGNILVKGNLFTGYLGNPAVNPNEFYETGDLGYLEDDYLYIIGREKNVMVLKNGRKLSSDWLEHELLQLPSIKQAVVIADGRPFVTTVITARDDFKIEDFQTKLNELNERLPTFARIKKFIISDEEFTQTNGLLDKKFKPATKAIIEKYSERIEKLYTDRLEN